MASHVSSELWPREGAELQQLLQLGRYWCSAGASQQCQLMPSRRHRIPLSLGPHAPLGSAGQGVLQQRDPRPLQPRSQPPRPLAAATPLSWPPEPLRVLLHPVAAGEALSPARSRRVAQPWTDDSEANRSRPTEFLLPPQPGPCSQTLRRIAVRSRTAHSPSSHYLSMNKASPCPREQCLQVLLRGASDQQRWRAKVKKTMLPAILPLSAEKAGMLPLPAGNVGRIIHLSSNLVQFIVINTVLSVSFRPCVIFPLF